MQRTKGGTLAGITDPPALVGRLARLAGVGLPPMLAMPHPGATPKAECMAGTASTGTERDWTKPRRRL